MAFKWRSAKFQFVDPRDFDWWLPHSSNSASSSNGDPTSTPPPTAPFGFMVGGENDRGRGARCGGGVARGTGGGACGAKRRRGPGY